MNIGADYKNPCLHNHIYTLEFEAKIDLLFEYVHTDDSGKRLIAKMQADGLAFDSDEIYDDFAKIYRKFIRRHKDLGELFLKESSDIVNQICDDFERTLKTSYADMEIVRLAADKDDQYLKNEKK